MTPSNACAGSGSPMTPVEARNTSVGLAADGGGGEFRGECAGVAAAFAGKGVGVAGIDHERAGPRRP